ncbi:MAG: (d)CMP kinase [Oscillospiraceae bacterium]|nr:(d)CMP kinase [Oscillospiraceae bacterium]
MNGFYSIAIDGPSGAGKSTQAKRLAAAFNFIYVDTGAIYRTLGLACYRAGIDRRDVNAVMTLLPTLDIGIEYNEAGEQCMLLNGENVSREIRLPEISLCASDVSAHQQVRSFLLEMQRKFARMYNVIMDGRDIGTVVLPDADLKIFLTASAEARAQRRMLELKQKGSEVSFDEVLKDINYRDDQDTHRAAAPLRKAEDAVEVDTSDIGFEETFERLCEIVIDKLSVRREDLP